MNKYQYLISSTEQDALTKIGIEVDLHMLSKVIGGEIKDRRSLEQSANYRWLMCVRIVSRLCHNT